MFDAAPRIQSAGLPPERHAERVIAEMTRWLIGAHERDDAAMKAAMGKPPGNPVAQERWRIRLLKASGRSIIIERSREVQARKGKRRAQMYEEVFKFNKDCLEGDVRCSPPKVK
jgi:hypothetical protein